MLELKKISSGYDKKQVIYDASLNVSKGEVVLLTGGNGSGKSTLLKVIYNILPCWSGEILFENKQIQSKHSHKLLKLGIVYIPQKKFCFENLDVQKNLEMAGSLYTSNELKRRIEKVYHLTDLGKYKKRKPFSLSGGERKLLGFGMGLIHNPRLILFDEPLAGVDTKGFDKIINIINNNILNRENGVLIVEHKNSVKELYTRKVVIELGKIKS